MSKLRPSDSISRDLLKTPLRRRKMLPEYWRQRVFQNSFTRNGKLIKVTGWSVKIQHNGKRTSFSLESENREDAAREALDIFTAILNRGWAAALRDYKTRMASSTAADSEEPGGYPKTDPRYWIPRLLHRKHNESIESNEGGNFSARIHHDGLAYYFPLSTDSRDAAAEKAMRVYQTVVKHGWDTASQMFSREVTVAVFWSANPLGYTYTTLFTRPADEEPKQSNDSGSSHTNLRVALIEGDASARKMLTHWIDLQKGFRNFTCYGTGKEALEMTRERLPELILVNRTLPDMLGQEVLAQINILRPDLPAFTYGIYEDSDQVYYSFSGVSAGYAMRRRPPKNLLEPIESGTRPYSKTQAGLQIQQYFQNLFRKPPSSQESPEQRGLTPREHEILDCVSKGYVDKEIAARLGISPWTVHGHLKNIYDKLRVRTRTEAVVKYLSK